MTSQEWIREQEEKRAGNKNDQRFIGIKQKVEKHLNSNQNYGRNKRASTYPRHG